MFATELGYQTDRATRCKIANQIRKLLLEFHNKKIEDLDKNVSALFRLYTLTIAMKIYELKHRHKNSNEEIKHERYMEAQMNKWLELIQTAIIKNEYEINY
jgi:hypothetical protein